MPGTHKMLHSVKDEEGLYGDLRSPAILHIPNLTRAEVKEKPQAEVRLSLPPGMSSNSQSQTFCQVSSLSLQIDNMHPEVTDFAITAAEELGCQLRAATSPAELAALDVWLVFNLSGVVNTIVHKMPVGQEFTSVDVIADCRLVNPQAVLK